MESLKSLSIFFPAYNDAATIPSMVISAFLTVQKITNDFEIIVVNDGSKDHTAELLNELQRLYPQVRVITHPQNRGYGAALRTGFSSASKEWVFYTDGDAQYDPRELVKLVEALESNIDVVNGYKIERSDPLHRIIIGRLYHHIVRMIFGFRLRDVDCDYRLMRRSIFDKVQLTSTSGTICLEMVKKDAGLPLPVFRSPGSSLSQSPWKITVLQLLKAFPDRHSTDVALVDLGCQETAPEKPSGVRA